MPLTSPFLRLLCLFCSALLLGNCSPYLSPRQNSRLSHEIIFPDKHWFAIQAQADSDIKRYIDPVLIYRHNLFGRSMSEIADSGRIEALLLDNVKPMRLTIPSKWQRLYQYYQGDSEASIEHSENAELLPKEGDFTLFRFYSPLIPTRERNIYAMQVLFNTIFVDGSISRRMWFLKINYFTIKRGKVVSQQRSHDKVIIRTY